MIKIIIVNEQNEKLEVVLTSVGAKDRLIDALYPNKGERGLAKGYVTLVNHMFGEAAKLKY